MSNSFKFFLAKINWRTVLWGYGFQFVSALLLLRWETGKMILDYLSGRVILLFSYSYTDGSNFVFGWLWKPPNICGMYPVLAFEVAIFLKLYMTNFLHIFNSIVDDADHLFRFLHFHDLLLRNHTSCVKMVKYYFIWYIVFVIIFT